MRELCEETDMHERAALEPGEHCRVDLLADLPSESGRAPLVSTPPQERGRGLRGQGQGEQGGSGGRAGENAGAVRAGEGQREWEGTSGSLLRMRPPRGPRSTLCVVVLTTCAWGSGEGYAPPATNPEKCAMSTSRYLFRARAGIFSSG